MPTITISDFTLEHDARARELYHLLSQNNFKVLIKWEPSVLCNAPVFKCGYFKFYPTKKQEDGLNIPVRVDKELWFIKPHYTNLLNRRFDGKSWELTGKGY